MLPIKFQVNWFFGSEEEMKNRFSDGHHGGHLQYLIATILAVFDLCFQPSFKSTGFLVQEK